MPFRPCLAIIEALDVGAHLYLATVDVFDVASHLYLAEVEPFDVLLYFIDLLSEYEEVGECPKHCERSRVHKLS